ncbi:MAG: class I SAM-dependent methyltransferase [Alphaproteobacteria bacterium]
MTLAEEVRDIVEKNAPDLLSDFDTLASEAAFARQWIAAELSVLHKGDKILEVGAGIFLLACELQRDGYEVTALEPVIDGFLHFERLQQLMLDYAQTGGFMPKILRCTGEELAEKNHFRLAYSVNVMEHVDDIDRVLQRVIASLTVGGTYRFVCPNYHFPYEPHFRIPTFGSKATTGKIMHHAIANATYMEQPEAVWKSLNWITVSKIKALCQPLPVVLKFDTGIIATYIHRALHDAEFKARQRVLSAIGRWLDMTGAIRILRFLPPHIMPIMDVIITKRSEPNHG